MYCGEIKSIKRNSFNELKRGSVEGVYDPEYADEKAWEKRTESRNKTILEKINVWLNTYRI